MNLRTMRKRASLLDSVTAEPMLEDLGVTGVSMATGTLLSLTQMDAKVSNISS